MKLARGAWSHILVGAVLCLAGIGLLSAGCLGWGVGMTLAGIVLVGFMVYFFRDPERVIETDPDVLPVGADGWVRQIEMMPENNFLKCEAVRISVFLTPFDVHVNRTPMAGRVAAVGYTPGKHVLTIRSEASEVNEHSTIHIQGERTSCLIRQIVGPIVRRVQYWIEQDQQVAKGERIGIMKFGSRLDIHFPAADVEVLVRKGDRAKAGITPMVRIKRKDARE